MSKKMLIDASHSEETRVAVLDEKGSLQDYEFKSSTKETVKGNIYLAKVARVEPSLQAAFVDYGGNRHGFLAFNEIHPDYFRIPVSDRKSLEESFEQEDVGGETEESPEAKDDDDLIDSDLPDGEEDVFQMPLETVGGDLPPMDDEDEDLRPKSPPLHRRYKIQEVIHKNQILLVQVAKEERGGKGAALTTFLSLAGRYCVLMPNSPRSGGISRKISNLTDRKRLREILESFNVPSGMGLIVRTAGKDRTRMELRRDAQYLMRLWDNIRSLTLKSVAPDMINREDNIIKRAIRDLYTKDITEILIEGEEGYKVAKDFMKTLMPSHSKRIQRFKREQQPLFHQFGVESQVDAMHDPEVRLPSGGSIVIHPTEALVSIDINSGKATKERHIEKTATKTNLEAAEEIARQVRLRDLAGLIVVDFIDMDEPRHISSVERKVRDAFRDDRARIQIGRISPFGLLEMSRQRLAPSILERSAHPCQHCKATGFVRSTESFSLHVLRLLEEEGARQKSAKVKIEAPADVILYLMNHKRDMLADIEERHGLAVVFERSSSNFQTCSLAPLEAKKADGKDTATQMSSQNKEIPSTKTPTQQKDRQKTTPQNKKESPDSKGKELVKGREESSQKSNKNKDSQNKEAAHPESDPTQAASEASQPKSQINENEGEKRQESSSQRKRRPRRRSKRLRRPHNDDSKEAAQDKSSTPLGQENDSPDSGKVMPQSAAPEPKTKDQASSKTSTPKASQEGSSSSKEKKETEKEDSSKSNWWRRLLD